MRILSFVDILGGKHLPTPSAFGKLLEVTRESLAPLSHDIVCAVAGGSVIVGRPSATSDFEFVVISAHEDLSLIISALQPVYKLAKSLNIPLDGPTFITQGELRYGHHSLSPSYVKHLRYAASHGGLLIGSPDVLTGLGISKKEDAERYISHKMKKIRPHLLWINTPPEQDSISMEIRAEVLNTWKYAGIRFAEACGLDHKELRDDWQSYIPQEAQPLLQQLESIREKHIELTRCQINHPSLQDWREELHYLDTVLPKLAQYLSILEKNLR